jgi:hypothetical protein
MKGPCQVAIWPHKAKHIKPPAGAVFSFCQWPPRLSLRTDRGRVRICFRHAEWAGRRGEWFLFDEGAEPVFVPADQVAQWRRR